MSNTEVITGEAPSRYALALLELAEESKSLKTIEKDAKTLKETFEKSVDLQRLASSPVFSIEQKVSGLTAVAKKANLSQLMMQFIGTVTENRRAGELPAILSAFEGLLAQRKGSQIAKITSAQKLSSDQLASLKENLKKSLGRPVEVETRVDPDLLGGFIVRVGSKLYDSSLKTKLDDLKIALKEA